MIDDTLTMIPGPTPVHPRILRALSEPTRSHQDPGFVNTFRSCLADLRRVMLGDTGQPFVVSGSGTLAMEMALVNTVAPGERLLVVSHGYFGDRWVELAEALGLTCEPLRAEWGAAVPPEGVADRLQRGGFAALAVTHVDTSTGVAAPVEAYAERARAAGVPVIVDGVCATAGMEERFDAWGLDVLLTGAQKALGAPPGLALVLVSPRALARRRALGRVTAYTADLLRWLPVMEDPARYFSTPPVNEILALAEALRLVLDEGLAARFRRHADLAAAFRAGAEAVGLVTFTRDDCRADTLSVLRYPDGVDDAGFRAEMARRGVVVAGALGPIAGAAFRVGHMGNIGPEEVLRTLGTIEGSLVSLGRGIPAGAAVAAAAERFGGS